MVSSTNIIILASCVAIFAYRAFRKGLWAAALGLLGFIAAYAVSFMLGPFLGEKFATQGLQGVLIFAVAMVVIFIATSTVVTAIPPILFPFMNDVSRKHRVGGAFLGALTGLFCAMIVIWLVGVAAAMLGKQKAGDAPVKNDLLSEASSRLVSSAVRSGIQVMEKDKFKASATAAFISAPHEFTEAFAAVAQAPELRGFWEDGKAQFLMSEGHVDQLLVDPSFRRLVSSAAMQQVLTRATPQDSSPQEVERYFATQVSYVWRRMRDLRGDKRVVSILEDAEVKKLIAEQNPAALLANEKIQSLVKIVMEKPMKQSASKASAASVEAAAPNVEYVTVPEERRVVYKWRDDSGTMRYTDAENTPEDKRHSAERIVH